MRQETIVLKTNEEVVEKEGKGREVVMVADILVDVDRYWWRCYRVLPRMGVGFLHSVFVASKQSN